MNVFRELSLADTLQVQVSILCLKVVRDFMEIFRFFFSLCSPRSELTSENLKWLENVFRRTVGDNGEIRLKDFKNIVHSKNVSHGTCSIDRLT